MPATLGLREPNRAVMRPTSTAVTAAPAPSGATSRPASKVSPPRTICTYSGTRMSAPNIATE